MEGTESTALQGPLAGVGNEQLKSRRCKNPGQPATDAWSHIKLI